MCVHIALKKLLDDFCSSSEAVRSLFRYRFSSCCSGCCIYLICSSLSTELTGNVILILFLRFEILRNIILILGLVPWSLFLICLFIFRIHTDIWVYLAFALILSHNVPVFSFFIPNERNFELL